jgi:pimeloyl-ACP methyl ester carboxylesterase
MKTSFHRIYTEDGLELHGLLYEPDEWSKTVLVHVHGMGGNFYENKFLDYIASELVKVNIAFCVFNNRGCELIKDTYRVGEGGESSLVRVGTTYENFKESALDINAYIDFAAGKGFEDIHLSGHSLGCSKVVHYLGEKEDSRIRSLLLLSPSDMLGLVRNNQEKFEKEIAEATTLAAEGRGEEIMSEWVWGEYPISSRSYLSLFSDGADDAIFNFFDPEDDLNKLAKITIPTYAVMGRNDDALTVPIEETFSRLEKALKMSPQIKTEILGEANHGYRGHEEDLALAVKQWLLEVRK